MIAFLFKLLSSFQFYRQICIIFCLFSLSVLGNDSSTKYNNANEHFSAGIFDTWELRCRFTKDDKPTYWFETGNWGNSVNNGKKEYQKEGKNSKAGSHTLFDMKYYLYKGKNPLENYTDEDIIKRFYFYRFSAKADGLILLDNYLVAVDTYTKLVFSFAIPTSYKNILWKKIPETWGSLEDNISKSSYKFYEYDPVGIVRKDGTLELYKWYLDSMPKGDYYPTINEQGSQIATYGRAGRSPYYKKK